MRYHIACIIILAAILCVSTAAGDLPPIDLLITKSKTNLEVNGQDQAGVSVFVFDRNTSNPVPNLPVTFSLENPALGSLNPTNTITDGSGTAATTVTSGLTTGTTNISIVVEYTDGTKWSWRGDLTFQGYPDTINFAGDTPWLVAGDTGNTSLITLQAFNRTIPDPLLDVEFSLLDPTMGSLSVLKTTTDLQGKAITRFTPSTKSGNATIQAKVTFRAGNVTQYIPVQYNQRVDHAAPYEFSPYEAASEALVGDNVTIVMHYVDRYGNPIDSRRFAETISFSVTSPSYPNPALAAGFWNGTGFSSLVIASVDELGAASVTMRMDVLPGDNIVIVHPLFSGVEDTPITIKGIAETPPVVIEQKFSSYAIPDPYPNIPADGTSVFTILYTLKDQFGNGVQNQSFWMNTSVGESESRLLKTNASGQVKITYGPKTRTDIINITATAANQKPDGSRATNSQLVDIISTEPVQMVIMANPQLLPSWDVPGNKTAEIKAVVMDRYGNPVKNQLVNFSIGTWGYSYSQSTQQPGWLNSSLSTIQKNTSSQAYAIAQFKPGYFPGFGDPQESDSCVVTAQWSSYPAQLVTLNWTNVPYLSVSTNVTPMVAAWNDTITVQIKMEGNGYALRPKPIDVIVVLDTSGSMAWDISRDRGSSNERINAAKQAAKTFIGNMNPSRDRIGLVTFASDAYLRNGLTDNFDSVNQTIESLSAYGATQMRRGFFLGINELAANGRADAIKAVILMSDGEWNYDGSPVAHGTGWTANSSPGYSFSGSSLEPNNYRYYDGLGGTLIQQNCHCVRWAWWGCQQTACDYVCTDGEITNQNMSRYANASHVRLYDIFFASNPSSTVNTTLKTMAEANNGFYEYAPSASKLTEIFQRIAGILKEEAGVGIVMDLPFNDITITTNVSSWSVAGKDAFDYIFPTDEWKYWFNTNPVTTIYRFPSRDDSANWSAGNISFNIGTIRLNQAWETTYKLKVKATPYNVGRITLFDQDSVIRFNDGTTWRTISIPTTYLTCIGGQSQTQIGTEEAGYDITDKKEQGTLVTMEFDRKFMVNGTPYTQPWYRTWYETYYIYIEGHLPKTKIWAKTIPAPVPLHDSFTFDIKQYLPPGKDNVPYDFYIEGTDHVIDAVYRKGYYAESPPSKILIWLE